MPRVLRRSGLLAVAVAFAGSVAAAPVARATPTCDQQWTTGTAPPSGRVAVCVPSGSRVTLDSSREWSGLDVARSANIELLNTSPCPAAAITLQVDGPATIEAGGAIHLHTSCDTGGDSSLVVVGGTLTNNGSLDLQDCDSSTNFCGGARTLGGTFANNGTVSVSGVQATYSGGTWTNAGAVNFGGDGVLTIPDGAGATFDNIDPGHVFSNGVTDQPELLVGAGDTYAHDGGSILGSPIALDGAVLTTDGAAPGDIAVLGATTWASGGLASGQTLELSCAGPTSLAVQGAKTNDGFIAFARPYGAACTDVPVLDLTSGSLSNAADGTITAVASDGSITGAGSLANAGQVLALTNNLTLDAAPQNLVSGVLTGGAWTARAGTLGWPVAPGTDVTGLAADVRVIGQGLLPNFGNLAAVQPTGSLTLLLDASLPTAATTLTNAGSVVLGGGGGAGTLVLPSGGQFDQSGGLLTTGSTGTIDGDAVISGGTVAPGGSGTGTLDVTGSYTQGAAARLDFDLAASKGGGAAADQVSAATAQLAGTLKESVDAGYTPVAGTAYPVIATTGGRTGTFGTVACDPGFGCSMRYTTTTAELVTGPQRTTTTLARSAKRIEYGSEQVERLTVRATGAHGARLTGTAIVRAGRHRVCAVAVSRGAGSCLLRPTVLAAGHYALVARWKSSAQAFASSSGAVRVAVRKATTRTALTLRAGRFQITVSPRHGGVPTGKVAVREGARLLCTATLHRHHDHAVGSCSAAGLPFGLRRVVTAAYRGDRNFRFSRHSAAVTRR